MSGLIADERDHCHRRYSSFGVLWFGAKGRERVNEEKKKSELFFFSGFTRIAEKLVQKS